jgi:hypothetical protein
VIYPTPHISIIFVRCLDVPFPTAGYDSGQAFPDIHRFSCFERCPFMPEGPLQCSVYANGSYEALLARTFSVSAPDVVPNDNGLLEGDPLDESSVRYARNSALLHSK